MKCLLIALCVVLMPAACLASEVRVEEIPPGVGYLARADGTRVYGNPDGTAVIATVGKEFPFVAYNGDKSWLGIVSSESVEGGKAQVKYFRNGLNSKQGVDIGWVDLKDLDRIRFDCCGDNAHCSGMTAPLFKTAEYTECFATAASATTKATASRSGYGEKAAAADIELEKLRLQLEIERMKLEQEKLRLQFEQERRKSGER